MDESPEKEPNQSLHTRVRIQSANPICYFHIYYQLFSYLYMYYSL